MGSRVLIATGRVAAVAAVAALAGCGDSSLPQGNPVKPESRRNRAAAFSLPGADGAPVSLADYRGKVVLLNFWATWCGPCKIEIPWLVEFQRTYKDRGFTVVGLSLDEDGWDAVKPYAQRRKINYPTALASEEVRLLYGGVEHLPTSFLIDPQGRIAATHVGLVSKSTYQSAIEALLP
jgi:cytochrome c biogenesis protein CcmG/thiol:disulfide interchange protein DsbE